MLGAPERRLRRYGTLLLRVLLYGGTVAVCTSAVLGLALLMFGAAAFRSTPASVGLLVVSAGAGFVITIPMWRMLVREHRFRCFYCEGDTARV